jgi:pyruvate/2-oxoglutarate dehydrogenase complex dihydrolipoamide dehydrogenase (E3) component
VKARGYTRMAAKRFDRNLVVIGAGSAGLVTAYIAAAVKAKVTLIEKHRMGGDCLNTGCVPSKALIRSAKLLSHMRAPGIRHPPAEAEFDFAEVMERVQRVIRKSNRTTRSSATPARRGVYPGRRRKSPRPGRWSDHRRRDVRPDHARIVIAAGAGRSCRRFPASTKSRLSSPRTPSGICASCRSGWWCWAADRSARELTQTFARSARGDPGRNGAAHPDPGRPGVLGAW